MTVCCAHIGIPQAAALECRGQLTNALASKLLAAQTMDLGCLALGATPRIFRMRLSNDGHLPSTWQLCDYDDPQVMANAYLIYLIRLKMIETHLSADLSCAMTKAICLRARPAFLSILGST